MTITHDVIYGSLLENNMPPPEVSKSCVNIPGQYKGKKTGFSMSEEMLGKHLLLVGGTGSGKTNVFYHIVHQLKSRLTQKDVMLIFDSKGDFYSKFFMENDVVIGNSAMYRKKSAKWNIFNEVISDGRDKTSVAQNIQEICKSLFAERVERNSSNPFFPNASRDLLASIIAIQIREGLKSNNRELKDLIDSTTAEELINMLKDYKDLASVASYIEGKAGSQAQGVLSEMYSVTRDVFTGVFSAVGDFSMRQFIRNKGGRTAFIEYDLSIGDVLSPIYTLLFDLALKEALGRTSTQGNVYLIADELKLLPHLRHLEDGINFGRSLGVKILAGLQSIGQLNANYDNEAKAQNAISGFSSIFAFHSNDYNTRKYISDLFGENMILETFSEANGKIGYEKRKGFVVEDWDLVNLNVGEAIIGLPSTTPFKYKFELFKNM
ncbi:type IV secretory system Conjugative DNA transfer [Peptoanaerobacter stomatis]|uniref:Type IV secretory system Conjugative DNA transfer n=1 Tax=Peptoanaerobacter stomatis TaxID=796937 RepID=J6HF49_9FIRM|nr:type IV secretion system DNA-binding domain-containing protein [Peptoanaerobacter stomatis]EJU23610.1 type IV secretory system Conjugative DNA transfer [Peptoanaerobacter stomatis]NWO24282.1 type IV secretion system DNA-binding domain-containing protein [Peptostreptococcaceae bacterium oral taxon 081]